MYHAKKFHIKFSVHIIVVPFFFFNPETTSISPNTGNTLKAAVDSVKTEVIQFQVTQTIL